MERDTLSLTSQAQQAANMCLVSKYWDESEHKIQCVTTRKFFGR